MIIYILGKILNFNFPPHLSQRIVTDDFFCDAWRHLDWRKFCCRAGTPTPLPGALSWYGHKQLPRRLMGPPCSLQPGIDRLAWCPQLNPERLHVSQYVALRSWSGSWRSRHGGLACRTWNFRSCGFLRGLLGNGGIRAQAGLWWRRLGKEKVGAWGDSPQESIKTLCLRSHYGLPKFSPPLCLQLLGLCL